ncbi:putative DNA-invertase from lambdoid prophage Rac [Frankia sp. Hr75.2]|nr:putative DNA-invertase from lambdoid prophage Rac [Frankia sp. Hr75.2]
MTAILIGYARCSTDAQDLTAQHDRLTELGVTEDRIYLDHGLTGTTRARPGLDQALAAVRAGDTLVVPKLDRLARSVPDARDIADSLAARGIRLSLGGTVYDPTDPMGKMFFNILATFAEFEVDLLRLRTREGMAVARARGKLRGKQPKLSTKQQRELHRMHALVDDLGGPTKAVAVPCDVQDWEQVAALPARAEEVFGRLDAVFANAGVFTPTSFLHATGSPERWREMVLTNVYGTALVARATLPALVRSCGHLLLTGSVTGRVTVPGQLYSATKWAVTAMAQSIRAEVTGTGVRVTLIQPGLVDTGERSPGRVTDPALDADDVARTVLFALDQPDTVDIGEIVIRPTGQHPHR